MLSLQSGFDRQRQLHGSRVFEQIPARPGMKRFGRVGRAGLHGEEDESCVGTKRSNLTCGVDPVQQRHGNVQDDQVWFKTLSRLDERTAV